MVKFEYRHEDSRAASARNWRRILLVDGSIGLFVLALGIWSIAAWNEVVGWGLTLLGIVYVLAIIGRFRSWRAHRDAAGLDG